MYGKARAESDTPSDSDAKASGSALKESVLVGAEAAAHTYFSNVARRRATVAAAIAVGTFKLGAADAQTARDPSPSPDTPSGSASASSSPARSPRQHRLTVDLSHDGGEPESLQLLQPFIEPDPNFPDFEAIVAEEARAQRQPRLARARARYRRAARLEPVRYADVVNLAACHHLLGQPALALPLLAQAAQLNPERPTAHVNQVLCLAQLGDRPGATAAIRRTFAEATELADAQHALLLRCKAAVLRGDAGQEEDLREFRVGVGYTSEASASEVGQAGQASDAQTMEKLRAGLRALRSSADEARPSTPPWGRLHAYADDLQATKAKDIGERTSWQPLLPDQLEVLRGNLGVHTLGSLEREECARAAYEAAKSLAFLRRLLPEQAINVLAAADFLEIENQEFLFRQGDLVDFMYIIASGSVRVEVFMEACGCAVAVDSLFDGQLFGEQAAACNALGSKTRRASIVAQEHTCLIRLLPVDYRRIMGAPESSRTAVTDEPSPEEVHLRANAISRRASARRRAMPDNIRLRLDVLKRWPHLVGASDYALAILASNVQEVQLRHGDEFVHVGQTLEGCFLLLDGVCKVFIRPEDIGEDDEGVQVESARLCGHLSWRELGGLRRGCRQGGLGIGGRYPQGAWGLPARRALTPRAPDNRSARRPSYSARPVSRGELRKGVPRMGRPWEKTLRGEPLPEVLATPTTEELCLCSLHAGQAFGLCALTTAQGECAQAAGARVRIDSCTARLIVLTRHSLLYLPETVATSLLAQLRSAEDPVRPPPELVRGARRHHLGWAVTRERVLRAQLTTSA